MHLTYHLCHAVIHRLMSQGFIEADNTLALTFVLSKLLQMELSAKQQVS